MPTSISVCVAKLIRSFSPVNFVGSKGKLSIRFETEWFSLQSLCLSSAMDNGFAFALSAQRSPISKNWMWNESFRHRVFEAAFRMRCISVNKVSQIKTSKQIEWLRNDPNRSRVEYRHRRSRRVRAWHHDSNRVYCLPLHSTHTHTRTYNKNNNFHWQPNEARILNSSLTAQLAPIDFINGKRVNVEWVDSSDREWSRRINLIL